MPLSRPFVGGYLSSRDGRRSTRTSAATSVALRQLRAPDNLRPNSTPASVPCRIYLVAYGLTLLPPTSDPSACFQCPAPYIVGFLRRLLMQRCIAHLSCCRSKPATHPSSPAVEISPLGDLSSRLPFERKRLRMAMWFLDFCGGCRTALTSLDASSSVHG
jgi:hypothetical protein